MSKWQSYAVLTHSLKRAKSSITQTWIIRFRLNIVQNLNAWHPKCSNSSRSRGQKSRSRRDITCAKIRKIIDNSAGDCSISLKFRTDFAAWLLMYHELSRSTGQRSRSQLDIMYQQQKRYNSGTDKLSKVKLGENYPTAERNTKHVQGHKVKQWNRNNSVADCSIAFKFGTEFHHVTEDTL